ncbi:conserved hypothetical protein [[Clostridium] ultunense Esp]|nr:conserved hypothetical protein [[Clostridium] ultunense Esp]
MTTMKASKHEILKSQWQELIKEQGQSGLSIRQWCRRNNKSHGKFYYWQRIVRGEALIKAGTLALSGNQPQFVEVKPTVIAKGKEFINGQGTCAILRSNRNEIEILNGADSNTLELILSFIGK